MVKGYGVVSRLIVGNGAVIIPLTVSVLNLLQNVEAFPVLSVLTIVCSRTQVLTVPGLALLLAAEALAAEALAAEALAAEAPEVLSSGLLGLPFALLLIHNHIVGLLHFFEFFFVFFLIRFAYICIGMVLSAETAVCFFYFIF